MIPKNRKIRQERQNTDKHVHRRIMSGQNSAVDPSHPSMTAITDPPDVTMHTDPHLNSQEQQLLDKIMREQNH